MLDHPVHLQRKSLCWRLFYHQQMCMRSGCIFIILCVIHCLYRLKPMVNAWWTFRFPNPYNYLLSPPINKRPCLGNHYSKCPKSVSLVGYLTYLLVLIFLGYVFFMLVSLISYMWIVNSLKREIIYYIFIPRMFSGKNTALQRAMLNGGGKISKHPLSARNCGKCFTFTEDT